MAESQRVIIPSAFGEARGKQSAKTHRQAGPTREGATTKTCSRAEGHGDVATEISYSNRLPPPEKIRAAGSTCELAATHVASPHCMAEVERMPTGTSVLDRATLRRLRHR